MPLYYREGFANAFKQLKEKINKQNECLKDLQQTNPSYNKKRIKDTKGSLLVDSYC
jgi:hypothetical protein